MSTRLNGRGSAVKEMPGPKLVSPLLGRAMRAVNADLGDKDVDLGTLIDLVDAKIALFEAADRGEVR